MKKMKEEGKNTSKSKRARGMNGMKWCERRSRIRQERGKGDIMMGEKKKAKMRERPYGREGGVRLGLSALLRDEKKEMGWE